MAKASVPVAQKDENGNLKRITTTNESYLAFKAGEFIAQSSLGTLLSATDTGNSIGSFQNTFYTGAVGTHSGTSLETGSTSTPLYQKEGSGQYETSAGFRRPLKEVSGSLYEMTDSDFTALSERLQSFIVLNEYPGAQRLATTTPGADWTKLIDGIFTDTNTGTAPDTTYHVWVRTSGTEPTSSCNPMYLRQTAYGEGSGGTYDGNMQAMNEDQIKESFGRVVAETFEDGSVGEYIILASAQGLPGGGTWSARGIAIDTRNETGDQQYTNQYTGFSAVQYAGERTYASVVGQYTGDRDFAGTRQFAGSRNYASVVGQYTGDYNFTGQRQFLGTLFAQFAGNRAGSGTNPIFTYPVPGFTNPPSPGNPFNGNPFPGNPTPGNPYPGNPFPGNPYGPTPGNPTPPTVGFLAETGNSVFLANPPNPGTPGGVNPGGVNPGGVNPGGVNPGGVNPGGVNPSTPGFTNASVYGLAGGNTFFFNVPGQFAGTRGNAANYQGDRDFAGTRAFAGSRNYADQYTRPVDFTGARSYAGDRTYTDQYTGEYTRQYSNQYTGETILSSTQTIETYTLYVRVS